MQEQHSVFGPNRMDHVLILPVWLGRMFLRELHAGMGPRNTPWRYKQTDHWIRTIRPVFHYISWEYGLSKLKRSLNDTNFEHPELVSIIVMRHPMERLLSDIGHGHQVIHDTEEEWWEYANNRLTDNFAPPYHHELGGMLSGRKYIGFLSYGCQGILIAIYVHFGYDML